MRLLHAALTTFSDRRSNFSTTSSRDTPLATHLGGQATTTTTTNNNSTNLTDWVVFGCNDCAVLQCAYRVKSRYITSAALLATSSLLLAFARA